MGEMFYTFKGNIIIILPTIYMNEIRVEKQGVTKNHHDALLSASRRHCSLCGYTIEAVAQLMSAYCMLASGMNQKFKFFCQHFQGNRMNGESQAGKAERQRVAGECGGTGIS